MEKQSFTITVNSSREHKIIFSGEKMTEGNINGKDFLCDVISTSLNGTISTSSDEAKSNRFHVLRDHKSYEVEIVKADVAAKTLTVKVNGHSYSLNIKDKYDELLHSLGMDKLHSAKVNELKAPMPGLVLDVVVNEGQLVKKGDALVVLEAMKMENILKSPADVTVKKISVKKGTAVEKNQVLVLFS